MVSTEPTPTQRFCPVHGKELRQSAPKQGNYTPYQCPEGEHWGERVLVRFEQLDPEDQGDKLVDVVRHTLGGHGAPPSYSLSPRPLEGGEEALAVSVDLMPAKPEEFPLQDGTSRLELRFLGGREVRLEGQRLNLPPRLCEIIALLAMEPGGVNGERLLLEIYGDSGNPRNLQAAISKLRRLLPIASKPYRLAASCGADFLEMEEMLSRGRVRDALALYRGAFLPDSDAEGVVTVRRALEASLRHAVLASGDAEAMMELAQRLGDDLELWEAALSVLPSSDPRYPIVRARIEQVREGWENDGARGLSRHRSVLVPRG